LQYNTIREEIMAVTKEVYESQYFILGPQVETLEDKLASYCGTKFALGVSSGSDALLVALMAAEIGQGDYVLTTPYTFFATAGAIARVGAHPVFVDIDPDTFNISPSGLRSAIDALPDKRQQCLKALIPVHLYGQCAPMEPIGSIAREYNLFVIEDAAQAIGAEYRDQRAGSMGDCGCFSFFPSKNLGAFGDGGLVTTNDDALYEKLQIFRMHGSHPKYYHRFIGGNFRLDALQAAIVGVKLKYLDQWTSGRQANAARYRQLFADTGLDQTIKLPSESEQRHIYNQFVIIVPERRDALRQALLDAGIGTEIYYPVPLHLQECFAYLGYKEGEFPVSEMAAKRSLALPIYPELTEDQLAYVVEKVKGFYAK
jgi:dTDP-4-amino-4,6-dideoxygalactose transaminase